MRRRYRRSNYHNSYDTYKDILLAEFQFYNKKKKLIDDNILTKIYSKVIGGETVYWTNADFAKSSVGFKMYKEEEEVYIRIIELKYNFTVKQFNSCKEIIGEKIFIGFDMTEDEKHFINDFDTDDIIIKNKNKTLNNWKEVVDFLIECKVLNTYGETDENEFETFNNDLKMMFGEEIIKPKYSRNDNRCSYCDACHIFKVIERRINDVNYRIAVISDFSNYSTKYKLRIIDETNKDYNYIDTNRFYIEADRDNFYYLDMTLMESTEKGEIKANLDLFKLMINNISDVLGDRKVITPSIYRFYADRVSKFENYDYRGALDEKQMAIMKQYEKIMSTGKEIKIDHTTIGKNRIRVDGENFDMTFDDEFINIADKLPNILGLIRKQDVRYNFNALYEGILNMSKLKYVRTEYIRDRMYREFEKQTFEINGMEIEVEKDANRMKINGTFCRIADVYDILTRAICYNSIKDYNKFIKDVSYIGMEWKKMIAEGIHLEINNPFNSVFRKIGEQTEEHLYLRFSLLWDADKRTQVYLVLGDKKYPIRYKGKFKSEFNMPRQTVTMASLKKKMKASLDDINDEMIIEVVEKGIEEAKIVKERGLELVQNTIKEVNAKEGSIDLRGNNVFGFEFKGRVSGSKYFVEKNHLTVFKWMDGTWNRRCVVDDSSKERIYEDRLANRLVNIYNEPARIFTIH